MLDKLLALLTLQYPPHGYCLLWEPWLIWSHVVSDTLIAAAYFSIPVTLVIFTRKRRDIAYSGLFWAFAMFITACGFTHVIRIWNMWHGDYGIEALVKVFTAAISLLTAILLWPLLPKLLALSSPAQLRKVNEALRAEIAQRQKMEAALLQARKLEAVGRLADGMAHDFNNVLQVIEGTLSLLGEHCGDDPRLRPLIDGAQDSVERGARLTRQLLCFSQVQMPAADVVGVPDLAAHIRPLVARTLPPQIGFVLEGGELPIAIRADRVQLELAILNLAINAREAMPAGGELRIGFAVVAVAGRTDLLDGQYLCIQVSDTGVGMEPSVAERAFEPFFSTKPSSLSAGLGLSVVYGLARQSGGAATVESTPSVGTVASLYLPIDETIHAIADAEQAIAAETRAALKGRTLLVVDDEAPTRNVIAMTLESLGCVVRQADGGAEALRMADAEWPDLFLLDFGMAGMNGAELAAALRGRRPDCRIVFLTGFADAAAIEAAVGKNAVVLDKPVSAARLAATLAAALR